jgi:drug/metabolite transporter (DMT)-like permease
MNPALLGVIAALSWGTHDFAARFPSRDIGPRHAVFGVTLAGFVWLSLWLAATGTAPALVLDRLWLPALSGISFAFATIWLFAALTAGPIAVVAPIVGAYPTYAVAFALILGSRPTATDWAAMAAVVLGVILVARQGENRGETAPADVSPQGAGRARTLGYAFAAGLGFACSLTAGQYAAPHYGEIEGTWLARIFGLAAVTLLCLTGPDGGAARLGRYGRWWILLAVMGLLDSLALTAVIAAGHQPNAEIATVTSSAFGAVTVILARLFLKEAVAPMQWGGIVLIFAGVGVLSA